MIGRRDTSYHSAPAGATMPPDRAILDALPQAVILFDGPGAGARVVYANPAALALTGYATLNGRTLGSLADAEAGMAAGRRADGSAFAARVSLTRGGAAVLTEVPGPVPVGEVTPPVVSARMPALGGWELDGATRSIRWTEEAFGAGRRDGGQGLPLEAVLPLFHPEDRAAVRDAAEAALTAGTPFDREFRLSTGDGRVVWVRAVGVPEVSGGRVVRVHGTFQDVTERKLAEEALRATERRYADLVHHIDGIVWEVDARTFRFTFVSPQAERITGFPVSRWLGEEGFWVKHIHPEDRDLALSFCLERTRRGEDHDFDYRMIAADGRVIWLHDVVSVQCEGGEAVTLRGVMVDVTRRRELEERLRETQRMESLGLLAGGLAHDLNNLLTTVLGHAGLAAAALPEASPVRASLAAIEEASVRAAEMCHGLLGYAGRGRVVVGPADLAALAEESVRLIRLSVSPAARLALDLPAGLPAANVDASQMRQVVMNLVMNASDALGGREGEIRVTAAEVRWGRDELDAMVLGRELAEGRYVLLEVADTGCGMDEGTRRRVFDPFFTTKPSGRGLGMAAVLGIVKAHGGAVQVRSAAGEGTAVRLVLPAGGAGSLAPPRPEAPAGHWSGTVLVADDEGSVRHLACLMLESLGFDTVRARDGVEALEVAREGWPTLRLVLLDMTMPRMGGREACAAIRELAPGLPVLVMSGYSESGLPAAPGVGFLKKPFKMAELADALRALLGVE